MTIQSESSFVELEIPDKKGCESCHEAGENRSGVFPASENRSEFNLSVLNNGFFQAI